MNVRPPGAAHFQLFALSASGAVLWRLLSGNNRELGRSVDEYADAETCRVAIKELIGGLDDLDQLVRRTQLQQWVWELRRDDERVVRGARPFDRRIRCVQGVAQFLRNAPDAHMSEDVMVSAARRWVTSAASNRTTTPLGGRGPSAVS